MASKQTNIQGVYTQFRENESHVYLKVFVRPEGAKQTAVPSSFQTLKAINRYLKARKLHQEQAEKDADFLKLRERLFQELRKKYALKVIAIEKKLELKSKTFNFETVLDEFEQFKSETTAVGRQYRKRVEGFWLPFFLREKGCQHPSEFRAFRADARRHIRSAKMENGEKYSPFTWHSFANELNQFMAFLVDAEYLKEEDSFSISAPFTEELKKKMRVEGKSSSGKRTKDTYSIKELEKIKVAIDTRYAGDIEAKKRAYAIFFGVITGLRAGNILGLKPEDLFPEASVPHFRVGDNVVKAWGRGKSGVLVIPNATKTSVAMSEDEVVRLPLVQPSRATAVEVATFLKENFPAGERMLPCHPNTLNSWWRRIASDCGFKYLHPHAWKHAYATNGAAKLQEWYGGNIVRLQLCCLHADYRTTLKYVRNRSDEFLEAFKDLK